MKSLPTAEAVYAPRRSAQEAKAETTTRVAREVIDAETASREAKTAKLREARLARSAQEAAEGTDTKKPRKKPAAAARKRG